MKHYWMNQIFWPVHGLMIDGKCWLAVEDCGLQRAAGRNTMLDLCLLFFPSYSFSPK